MRQWVLKITAYADRLLDDLELLDWPDAIKEMQRNWIGKSTGAEVDFGIAASPLAPRNDVPTGGTAKNIKADSAVIESEAKQSQAIRVFTTRPDTLFGATYMVLSPEHALLNQIVTADQKKVVEDYQTQASKKSDLERTELAKEKTGVFTGAYAINPVNEEKIPIWIADYVLATYGTGAIMAVPAHDERDFEFATKFNIPIQQVVTVPGTAGAGFSKPGTVVPGTEIPRNDVIASEAKQSKAFTGVGVCINSETSDGSFSINEMQSDAAKEKIIGWLEDKKIGKKSVQYKLRDWIFSRQRYWGEPFPIIHVDGKPKTLSEKNLPIQLPETESYKPTGTGDSPLAGIKEWVEVKDEETGKPALRETNTMPQWAGSCWYYLRYLDPKNNKVLIDPEKEKYWMNVDLYVGGAEHAVLHLLYARFWHKVLFDCGVVSTKEPFQRLVNQGMILGEDNQKMSKSRGNVVNPDDVVKQYGADSVRLYEMFMGPLEMTKPWSTQGTEGIYRFLGRVWRLLTKEDKINPKIIKREATPEELKSLHQTIKKVSEDLEGMRFNTAISALMVFVNEANKNADHSHEVMSQFILLLAPFAPHLSEELWQLLGYEESLTYVTWPPYNEKYLVEDNVEIAIMIGGKVRAKMTVSKEKDQKEIEQLALQHERVKEYIKGKELKKVIVVPGRMVNLVVK